MRITLLLITLLIQINLWAAPKEVDKKESIKKTSKEVSFDELLVQGKHHFSDEAIVTVEQDKVLDALLEIRKDFKDRIKLSAKRN
jgi:hypothetical protein